MLRLGVEGLSYEFIVVFVLQDEGCVCARGVDVGDNHLAQASPLPLFFWTSQTTH